MIILEDGVGKYVVFGRGRELRLVGSGGTHSGILPRWSKKNHFPWERDKKIKVKTVSDDGVAGSVKLCSSAKFGIVVQKTARCVKPKTSGYLRLKDTAAATATASLQHRGPHSPTHPNTNTFKKVRDSNHFSS